LSNIIIDSRFDSGSIDVIDQRADVGDKRDITVAVEIKGFGHVWVQSE